MFLAATGCSGRTWLSGGPAARYVRHEQHRWGGEALGRAVVGNSSGRSFLGAEAAARVLATSREQLAGFGLGPAWFGSRGRGLLTLDATPMLAFEHVPGSLLTVGTLRGGWGFGYAFEQNASSHASPWDPWVESRVARTTALTVELSGAIDAPITRAPEYSVGVLIGIVWLDQRTTNDRRNLPLLFGPGGGRGDLEYVR